MGKTTTTESTSQLTAAPQGQLEQMLEGMTPEFIAQIQGIAGKQGAFGDRLEGMAGGLMKDFRGLPGNQDIIGYLKGGGNPQQRAELDRLTDERMEGARTAFDTNISNMFDAAEGAGAAAAGQAGVGGDFANLPVREAARQGAQASAEFGRATADIRSGIGAQIGSGMLTVNQAALQGVLGVSQAIGQTRGQEGALHGAASDIASRETGRLSNFRLATGRQDSSSTVTEKDPVGTALKVGGFGLNMLALGGAGGVGPLKGLMGGGGGDTATPGVNSGPRVGVSSPAALGGTFGQPYGVNQGFGNTPGFGFSGNLAQQYPQAPVYGPRQRY